MFASEEQQIVDREQLRLLRIGYFVSAGTTGLFALLGVFYMLMGGFAGMMIKHAGLPTHGVLPPHGPPPPPPEFVTWMFVGIGAIIATLCTAISALKLWVARCIRLRRSHTFCVAIAVLCCLDIPWGTALGVFSFVVLTRPSVKQQFASGGSAMTP